MQQLTPEGQRIVDDIAHRHGVSSDAVLTLLQALIVGHGTMAQFSHPELGGMGQWSLGGMTMVGDMFNNALKARVDSLCSELSGVLARQPLFARPYASQSQTQSQGGSFPQQGEVSLFVSSGGARGGDWWGGDFGAPSSTGSQNNIRYAYFPAARRLAIDIGGRVTVYDAGDHQISGVSQQQSGDASLTFTSQYGLVRISDLPVVSPGAGAQPADASIRPAPKRGTEPAPKPATEPAAQPAPEPVPEPVVEPVRPSPPSSRGGAPRPAPAEAAPAAPSGDQSDDIFVKIERLAALREKGILTEEEFAAKKAELLGRL